MSIVAKGRSSQQLLSSWNGYVNVIEYICSS